ncbi:MAG TPA: FAD-binding oxidoreductase [Chloroflexota bacterium]|nr:FAD-binding oxidoreductase [Chloroflexota bacterium]
MTIDSTFRGPDLGTSLDMLAAALDGEVILPAHGAYHAARRVLDAQYDCHPAAIVRPANARDVISAVNFTRELGLELAVRSGGHSPAGFSTCDGGLILDLSSLKAIDLDLEAGTVRVEPGATWGEVAAALHPHGLAITSGDFGSVGVGGLTTGGGIGWMVRKYGLTIDRLLAADVVLADGSLVRTDADHDPDLFWAIRGGGGNFGVVVSFLFRPHPAGMVTGGMIVYDGADLPRVVRGFADYGVTAPDELTAMVDIMHAPPLPFLPPERHGSLIVGVAVCYAGDPEAAAQAIAPLRSLATPLAEAVGPMPYPALFAFTDHALPPAPHIDIRSCFLGDIDDALIATLVERTAALSSPLSMVQLRALGGELSRTPADSTAFSHRAAPYLVEAISIWTDPAESAMHHANADGFWDDLASHAEGTYVGFLGNEGEERKRSAYAPGTYRRLAAIKAVYDPHNLFRRNHNIAPLPAV